MRPLKWNIEALKALRSSSLSCAVTRLPRSGVVVVVCENSNRCRSYQGAGNAGDVGKSIA